MKDNEKRNRRAPFRIRARLAVTCRLSFIERIDDAKDNLLHCVNSFDDDLVAHVIHGNLLVKVLRQQATLWRPSLIIIFRACFPCKTEKGIFMSSNKHFNDQAYADVINEFLHDIYYLPGQSWGTKIQKIRQYTEVILRRLLDYTPTHKLMIGHPRTVGDLNKMGYTEPFFRDALEKIRVSGDDRTHTQVTATATEAEYLEVEESLLKIYAYLFYKYFQQYPFGSNREIMSSFSLLPPIIRYYALNELYAKDPQNLDVIDKLSLAIMKAFSLDEALTWLDERKDALSQTPSVNETGRADLVRQLGPEIGGMLADQAPDMYSLCRDRVISASEERDHGGISYDSFETALKYYREHGVVEGDTPDVKEFNDLMAFVYCGRKEAEEQIATLDEDQYIINSITWILPPDWE